MATENTEPLFGHNNPMHTQKVVWDGHRSVRFASGGGLATVAYSYKLSHEEMHQAAERIAIIWNLMEGMSTDALRAALAEWEPTHG